MQVRVLNDSELGPFTDYVRDCPFGDVLQTPAWARLKARSGWGPHYLIAEDEGGVHGACLALERKLPRLPFRLLYCPRGPALDWEDPAAFGAISTSLRALADERRAILVKVDPPVPASIGAAESAVSQAGFIPVESGGFGGVQPRCVMKLDLSGGLERVFEQFKPKWRYNIRLAERKGVTVRTGDASDIDPFYDLLLETARRDRFLIRARQYFHDMWQELSRDGLIRLFLTEYEGKLLAGALMYVLGRQAWYTYGASSNEHRNVMPNHLMQWTMMQHAHASGCTLYDFRGVSCRKPGQQQEAEEPGEEDHLQGLNRFKAGFNAEFVEYMGEYDLPVSRGLYIGWTRVAPAILRMIKRKAASQSSEQPL